MKTERNILIAFILNLAFSVFEIIGGIFTGSVAIVSDAIHDMGDAASIGASYFLEKKSRKAPDEEYTYGYARYSVVGSLITTVILVLGSLIVIYNAAMRIINPTDIHYNGMIIFAIVGVAVNLVAAFVTREGDSLNQRAVNLHMLEDVLGWLVVLVGAVVMRFTDIKIIDPIMSIGVAIFILSNAISNLKEIAALFLEKTPKGMSPEHIKKHIMEIDGIEDVHHIHIWSLDGQNVFATMHIVTDGIAAEVKEKVREELLEIGIFHSTLELEAKDENCEHKNCSLPEHSSCAHHHHHHSHHHPHSHSHHH